MSVSSRGHDSARQAALVRLAEMVTVLQKEIDESNRRCARIVEGVDALIGELGHGFAVLRGRLGPVAAGVAHLRHGVAGEAGRIASGQPPAGPGTCSSVGNGQVPPPD